MLTAFGLGFTPHIQCQAGTDLYLRAHAVDVLLHLAIAPVAPFHGMRSGGQQRGNLFTHRSRFVQHHVSPTERQRLWRMTRGLPQ